VDGGRYCDYAGTFSISVLGGIIPAVMAWKQRYHQQQESTLVTNPLIPGGKVTLIVMIGVAFAVMVKQAIAIA
jgi:tyrosine-specific transport protein